MQLAEVKVFVTVVNERSFSRAADKLYRTQPAISLAIRRLEQQLGEPLFYRTARQPVLTPAGEALFREGVRLLQAADDMMAEIQRQSAARRTAIRIGGDEVSAHAVLPVIADFHGNHLAVDIEVRRMPDGDVAAALSEGAIDLGLVASDRVPARFGQIELTPGGLVLWMHRDHPLAGRERVTIGSLKGEHVVVPTEPAALYDRLAVMLRRIKPALVIALPGLDAVKHAVHLGLGAALVPRTCATGSDATTLSTARLDGATGFPGVSLMHRNDGEPSPNVSEFLESARTMAKGAPDLKVGPAPRMATDALHSG